MECHVPSAKEGQTPFLAFDDGGFDSNGTRAAIDNEKALSIKIRSNVLSARGRHVAKTISAWCRDGDSGFFYNGERHGMSRNAYGNGGPPCPDDSRNGV